MTSRTPRLDSFERNLFINGNMDFAQRGPTVLSFGTAIAATAAGKYLVDRFKMYASALYNTGASTVNWYRSTDVPTLAESGFQSTYSLTFQAGTGASPGASDYIEIGYTMEGYDYANVHSRKARFSFWTKSSVTGTYPITFTNGQSGGNARNYVTTYTVTTANKWEKKTIDITLDTSSQWNFDNSSGLTVYWTPTAGTTFQTATLNSWQTGNANAQAATGQTQWATTTNATMLIAQVMMIPQDLTSVSAASVDVPFHRNAPNILSELLACQRYCYVFGADGSGQSTIGIGTVYTATQILLQIVTPVPMRGVPSLTPVSSAGSWIQSYTGAASQLSNSTPAGASEVGSDGLENRFDTTIAGFTGLTVGFSNWNITSANAKLILDAEL